MPANEESRKFSTNTSAVSRRRCSASCPSFDFKSSWIDFLPRLKSGNMGRPIPVKYLVLSPAGGSTLMTSAPRKPRNMPHEGPMIMWLISTTRKPSRGKNSVSITLISKYRCRVSLIIQSENYKVWTLSFYKIERMNLKQLEAFVAIYETGGISRAADRERTAPSVISHH